MKYRFMTLGAMFAALTAVCAQITIPIGPVPISLSLLPVLLCGALMTPRDALISMGVYLLMGLVGLPVFSNLSGGAGKLFGVTGGYILWYLPCVLVEAGMLKRHERTYVFTCLAMACGVLACYLFGTVWFMVVRACDLLTALSLCVLPFLPGDAVKILLAAFLSERLRAPLAGMGYSAAGSH